MSTNSFDFHASKEIANALKENHSIYGFHFSGNYGYVDPWGFLVIGDNEESESKNLTGVQLKRRI